MSCVQIQNQFQQSLCLIKFILCIFAGNGDASQELEPSPTFSDAVSFSFSFIRDCGIRSSEHLSVPLQFLRAPALAVTHFVKIISYSMRIPVCKEQSNYRYIHTKLNKYNSCRCKFTNQFKCQWDVNIVKLWVENVCGISATIWKILTLHSHTLSLFCFLPSDQVFLKSN